MYNKKNYMGDPLICLLTVCVLLGEPCPDHTCISQGLPEVDTCKDPNIQEWLKDTVGSNVGRARYTLVRYTRPLFIRTMAIAVGRSIIANPADTKKLIEDIYEKNPSYFCPVTDIQTIMGGGADVSLDDHKDRWTRDHDNFDALCEADDKHVLAMSTHDDDTDREETDIFIYRAHIWLQKSAAATKCKGTEWFSMFTSDLFKSDYTNDVILQRLMEAGSLCECNTGLFTISVQGNRLHATYDKKDLDLGTADPLPHEIIHALYNKVRDMINTTGTATPNAGI